MKQLNIDQKDLLDKFSFTVTQSSLAKWLSLNPTINNGVSPEVLKEFRNILKTETDYLLYGEQEKEGKMEQFNNLPEFVKKVELKNGYVGAGSSGLLEHQKGVTELYVDINTISTKFRDKNINGITVIGDSMIPYVNDNDIVLYTDMPHNYPPITGKYIVDINGNLQLKNISFRINGDIIISSENKGYPDEKIAKDSQEMDNFQIVGIVVGRLLKN